MGSTDMWKRFREKVFPRHAGILASILGIEAPAEGEAGEASRRLGRARLGDVPVQVDWASLGDEARLDERLDYDLEMLARGLEGVDRRSVFVPESDKLDPEALRAGIRRIRIRRVHRPRECRLVVADGTLHVDFRFEGTGPFGAREVEALLLDREGEIVRRWVEPADARLSEEFDEVRRNRLPAKVRRLHLALRKEVPLRVDWASLSGAPDAPSRFLHMLGRTADALRILAREAPGTVVGPESVHRRAEDLARERARLVREAVRSVSVRGGMMAEGPAVVLAEGGLEVLVYQDVEWVPPGTEGPPRPVKWFHKLPGCHSSAIEELIEATLDLEVGPLLERIRQEDFPKAKAYLHRKLDECIGEAPGLRLRDRLALRKRLAAGPPDLEVDWESLLSPPEVRDRLAAIRKLETGPYNYNCDYGELFRCLMFALDDAFARSSGFPAAFLERVRTIRFEQVNDPEAREVLGRGGTILIRQRLFGIGGMFGDPEDLATRLIAAVEGMAPDEGAAPGGGLSRAISRLANTLGSNVEIVFPADLESACKRAGTDPAASVLAPLTGAFALLLEKPGYAETLRRILLDIRFEAVGSPDEKGLALQGATLLCRICPEAGAAGRLSGDELVWSLDRALALTVRSQIREIEREEHQSWERMLAERFGRELPIEVDWETFLADPADGGGSLYPLNVKEAGVMRLVYALNRWMDEDEDFREKAAALLRGLLVTSVPDPDLRDVVLDGSVVVYRCHADTSYRGFLTIDEIQMRLGELIS
jgi:hypothetical protein